MKEDIRVIKQIGTFSDPECTWQKELNIVSINNGPFKYDLREWSLDHASFKNGVSFENDEAKVLLAILKECFKDGGEDITIDLYPGAYKADKDGQVTMIIEPTDPDEDGNADEVLFDFLKERHIEYTDKREKGGALWIVGGHELDELMMACGELGYKFLYSEKGGRITKGQPGWYLRANKK